MGDMGDLVGHEGAAATGMFGPAEHAGLKEGAVDDELTAAVEQLEQARLALGRQEEWEDSPEGYPQTPPYKWWNWHDDYGDATSSQWSSVVDRSLALQGQPGERNTDDLDSAAPRPRRTDSKDGDAT
jgi:hypothetical protein